MRTLSLILLLVALAPSQTSAQSSTPRATYRVAGTVVSAIDNHPLQRATLQLLNTTDRKPLQTTTSDEYGHFAFTEVPPGNHELQGTAPTYLATIYDEHEGFSTGIITGSDADTESLTLKLFPESSISGVIVDESAEPVAGATTHLFCETHAFGDSRLVIAGMVNTDDFGHFELPHLRPGTYFLAVTAAPWYAVYPEPILGPSETGQVRRGALRQRGFPDPGVVNSIDPTLNVAYAATFYPGTTDPASAAPIVIRGGEIKDLDLQLTARPALTLTLPRAAPQNGQQENMPQLRLSFGGQPLNVMSQTTQTSDHTVITGLAPGDYSLTESRYSNNHFVGTRLHLSDHSVTADLPRSSAPAHLRVLVQAAHDTKLPAQSQVVLLHANREAEASQSIDEKNIATFDANPGDYAFAVIGSMGYLAVGQVMAGERLLPSNHVHLAPDQTASFTITVNPRTHTLKGVARKDGKPCPGAFILLIPTRDLHNIQDFYRQQSDLDGSFDLPGLAPGDYTLIAIEGAWDLDWHRDEILSHYLPAAQSVQIPDTAVKVQNLPGPVAVQSR